MQNQNVLFKNNTKSKQKNAEECEFFFLNPRVFAVIQSILQSIQNCNIHVMKNKTVEIKGKKLYIRIERTHEGIKIIQISLYCIFREKFYLTKL